MLILLNIICTERHMKLYLIKIPAQADLLNLETMRTLRKTVVVLSSQKILRKILENHIHPNIDYYDTDQLSFETMAKIIHTAHQIDKNIAYLCPDESNHTESVVACDNPQMMGLLQSQQIPYQIMPFHRPEYQASA